MKKRTFTDKLLVIVSWAIICAVIGLTVQQCKGQNLGLNGAGFFENYDTSADAMLAELGGDFTLRLPGGAISKFTDPYNNRTGWGMSAESIQKWFDSTGFDEDGAGLEKWLRKAGEQPQYSYMDELIKLQLKFPGMQVIWVLNVMNSTPEANIQTIRYLIAGGVNIVAVEAGNEVYGKYTSFEQYRADFEPIFQLITAEFPYIKKSLCSAPFDRREFVNWNNALKNYEANYQYVTVHFYLTEKHIPGSFALIPEKKVIDYSKPDPELTTCYNQLIYDLGNSTHFDSTLVLAKAMFPTKEIIVTEFNIKPAEAFNNTIAQSCYLFFQMVYERQNVKYLLLHNGIGPEGYPIIGRKLKQDATADPLIRRTGYFAYQAAEQLEQRILCADTLDYFFTFNNLGNAETVPEYNFADMQLDSIRVIYLTGQYLYSSSGAIGSMSNKQPPALPEITSLSILNENKIPANAYGFIAMYHSPIVIEPKPCIPHPKCVRPWYKIFHPKKCNCDE